MVCRLSLAFPQAGTGSTPDIWVISFHQIIKVNSIIVFPRNPLIWAPQSLFTSRTLPSSWIPLSLFTSLGIRFFHSLLFNSCSLRAFLRFLDVPAYLLGSYHWSLNIVILLSVIQSPDWLPSPTWHWDGACPTLISSACEDGFCSKLLFSHYNYYSPIRMSQIMFIMHMWYVNDWFLCTMYVCTCSVVHCVTTCNLYVIHVHCTWVVYMLEA